jgi:hypothetical protein
MAYEKGLVATLAEMEEFHRGSAAGDVIELMNQTNDILSDIEWMESNQTDGHLTRIRTGLPEVYWRRLYKGTPVSKGQWGQVKEPCGMLEARMELDAKEVELYGDKAAHFRLSEGAAFAEAMRQKVAYTLFYGDPDLNPDEFHGLSNRYPSAQSPHVLSAGGTADGKQTSMWLISWGANSVHGIYPKGAPAAGLRTKDLGTYMSTDTDGARFEVVGDKYSWDCGLAVRDWRGAVRICNIDVASLDKRKGESGFIDLQALTIRAKSLMPQNLRDRAVWYCPSEVLTALEMQASDAGNVQLRYGEYFSSSAVPVLHGRPVRQCDAISLTEAVI